MSFYSKHPTGSNTKAKVKQTQGKTNIPEVSALVSLNYNVQGLSLTHVVESAKKYKGTLEYVPESVKDLKVKAEFAAQFEEKAKLNKTLSAEYAWPNVKAKATVTDEPVLKASAVTGNEKFGAGLDLGWSFGASRLTAYNAALWWFENQNRLVLKHESTNKEDYKPGKFVLSAFREQDKFNFGGVLKYDVQSNDVGLELGFQRNTSETQQLKVKLDSEGQLGASLRHKLTNSVSLITATQLGIKELTKETGPNLQFGFKVKVSP